MTGVDPKGLQAARSAIKYLSHPETPWTDEQVAAVITAYLSAALTPLKGAPVAYAYVIDGECEEIGWGKPPLEDSSLVLLSASQPLPETEERETDEMQPDKYTGGDFNGVVRGKRS